MGLLAYIYDSEHGRDPLSVFPQSVTRVTITNAKGPFEPTADAPAVRLKSGPGGICKAVPEDAYLAGNWLMAGCSYIATSDSRFRDAVEDITGRRFYGAVKLHDRCED